MTWTLILSALLLLLMLCQAPSAQIMDVLYGKWKEYEAMCKYNMTQEPPPEGLVCNRTFDKFSCWPDALPNTTVSAPCPWYLPWHLKVQHHLVYKHCGPDGQWAPISNGSNRDARECELNKEDAEVEQNFFKTYERFKIVYTVGYSVSLGTLILAFAILVGFSKLHCMRNYIHMNLFASFILKSLSVLVQDILLKTRYTKKIEDEVHSRLSSEALAGCRAATVLMQYGMIANYYWLMVEGIYLYNLLVLTVFSERNYFALYLCIGWGTPALFIIPWVAVKYTYENIDCWSANNNMGFWWIIRSSVLLAIVINFVIFVRIIQILVSKMRAPQMWYTDYKFRLAKSTLTLIPLLGIHEVAFAFLADETTQGTLRLVKLFFDLFFGSFQGMLVAVLYCFMNKEVQSELFKKWKRWKLGKDIKSECKHMYSQTPRVGASNVCEMHKLVGCCHNGIGKARHNGSMCYDEKNSTTENITLSERQLSFNYPDSEENTF
ncbi:glucagon receptor L homeolog precursor [Xenopus laevis]|uniref:Glucagon receptor n=1 Tax=Xenopus laevis TaxID=8355 RepID=Q8UVY5_XENLA|nr:glucagon receptor L homeolog precursor [Xenopus laevis]AAL37166.1 glucagon receptor precursor [Xenopus laevis]